MKALLAALFIVCSFLSITVYASCGFGSSASSSSCGGGGGEAAVSCQSLCCPYQTFCQCADPGWKWNNCISPCTYCEAFGNIGAR